MNTKTRDFLDKSHDEIDDLAGKFEKFGRGITKTDVEHFISQFSPYTYLGLKLLTVIDYYDGPQLITLSRDLGNRIKALTSNNLKDVLICPLKPDPGSSAHSTQRFIRQTIASNAAEYRQFKSKFIHYSYLEKLSADTSEKNIFLVDDFIGSGDTVLKNWGRFQLNQNENYSYHIGSLVAYEDSMRRIEEETGDLEIVVSKTLLETHRAFHPNNPTFTTKEKKLLMQLCEKIKKSEEHKFGHRNGQSLAIFSDNAPNNSLPILHQRGKGWKPLFPRKFYGI